MADCIFCLPVTPKEIRSRLLDVGSNKEAKNGGASASWGLLARIKRFRQDWSRPDSRYGFLKILRRPDPSFEHLRVFQVQQLLHSAAPECLGATAARLARRVLPDLVKNWGWTETRWIWAEANNGVLWIWDAEQEFLRQPQQADSEDARWGYLRLILDAEHSRGWYAKMEGGWELAQLTIPVSYTHLPIGESSE